MLLCVARRSLLPVVLSVEGGGGGGGHSAAATVTGCFFSVLLPYGTQT